MLAVFNGVVGKPRDRFVPVLYAFDLAFPSAFFAGSRDIAGAKNDGKESANCQDSNKKGCQGTIFHKSVAGNLAV